MPDLYQQGDYDLAGFAVGAAERGTLLPRPDMMAGDVVLGLGSSGIHSNGFSLVRRIVEKSGLAWDAPAPFQPDLDLATSLLVPTKLYVRPILADLRAHLPIKGLAHITGGGLDENIPRVLPKTLSAQINLSSLTPPPVFGWLAREGNVLMREMLRTFNCGIGMTVIVAAEAKAEVADFLRAAGEEVHLIGELVPSRGNKAEVVYQGQLVL